MARRTMKLKVHPRNFSGEELIVNLDALAKEKFQLQSGDIIEIFPPEDAEATNKKDRLLLEVKGLSAELQAKGGPLSISNEMAQAFNLVGVREVCVGRVEREAVGLDLVELRFKEQCLTRSDMWRFTCRMIDKCVYTSMKLEFVGIRAQVSILWSGGENVSCGAIVKSTRVVFRSASAQVFLFIQISSEMWDFDLNGDLYFDKAVNGFLKELFHKYKEQDCHHEVTVVFFSRVYYDAESLKNLPPSVRSSLCRDKRGLMYEDFYQVIAEGCSLTDWSCRIVDIKKAFIHYPDLLESTRVKGAKVSMATEGNVLEALNLAINAFDKHYIDPNFFLTGHQAVIVTAGVGIFEVDPELTRLTKERAIDGGIAADFVCLTEQPLHAVPLFRYHSHDSAVDQEYHIPHWMNYSFYNPPRPWGTFRFQPRMQLSDHLVNVHLKQGEQRTKGAKLYTPASVIPTQTLIEDRLLNRVDYDEHDAYIFTQRPIGGPPVKVQSTGRVKLAVRHHSQDEMHVGSHSSSRVTFDIGEPSPDDDTFESQNQDDDPIPSPKGIEMRRAATFTSSLKHHGRARYHSESIEDHSADPSSLTASFHVGSSSHTHLTKANLSLDTPSKKKRSFINPFDPNKVHGEITAYHRRWMHTFPRNKEGYAFQSHHAKIQEETSSLTHSQSTDNTSLGDKKSFLTQSQSTDNTSLGDKKSFLTQSQQSTDNTSLGDKKSFLTQSQQSTDTYSSSVGDKKSTPSRNDSLSMRRGKGGVSSSTPRNSLPGSCTGSRASVRRGSLSKVSPYGMDSLKSGGKFGSQRSLPRLFLRVEDFASVRRTGMDWQSITEPACLPITTDYFPQDTDLNRDYFEYPTKLVVDSYGNTSRERKLPPWTADHQMMDTFEAFQEMISQRISQGFQLVVNPNSRGQGEDSLFSLHAALLRLKEDIDGPKGRRRMHNHIVVKMSLGRVFQKVELIHPDMVISIYRAKQRQVSTPIGYSYQLYVHGGSGSQERESWRHTRREFCRTRVEDYNWNYLDQHVCGYSDFDVLGESQKYWRCRYLLLPLESPLLCETPEERVAQEELLICNFVRFLESLNHIKRGPPTQPGVGGLVKFGQQILRRRNSVPATHVFHSSHIPIPQQSHSSTSSPTPSFDRQRSRRLPNINEDAQRPLSPRHDSQPHSRPVSPATASQRLKREKNVDKSPASEKTRGEKVSDTKTKATLELKPKSTKELDPSLRRIKSRDDVLHGNDKEHQRPLSPFKVKVSPKLSRKRNKEEIFRDLKEMAMGKKETTESAAGNAVTRQGKHQIRKGDSVPVNIVPPSPTPEESLESPLDHTAGQTQDSEVLQESFAPDLPLKGDSPLSQILRAMENPDEGIDFLGALEWLRPGCFIAMEAVKWLMENVEDITSRREAVKLMQMMMDDQLVLHASGKASIPFLDGFFFYYMPHKEGQEEPPKEVLERSYLVIDPPDFDAFSKNWFEVAIRFPSHTSNTHSPTSPSPPSSPNSLQHSQSPFYMGFECKETHEVPASMAARYVELNPDPQSRSHRPEWCFVHYDHTYHPTRAFQLEFQWMVSTVSLFHQTVIQSWVYKATMCGFNLVPVPMLQSLSQDHRSAHPFRTQHFIPLQLPSEVAERWKASDSSLKRNGNLTKLLSAITNRFGFLVDPSSLPPDPDVLSPQFDSPALTSRLYVHYTGCALLQPVYEDSQQLFLASDNSVRSVSYPLDTSTPMGSLEEKRTLKSAKTMKCGFYWYRNFLLPKQRSTPQAVLAKHDAVLEELTQLCSNKDGQLEDLCRRLD